MDSSHNSPQTVLYVEDSADDFHLFKLASRKCGTPFSLRHAADGEQAIAYLSGAGAYADREEFRFLCKTPPDSAARDRRAGRLLSTFGRLQPDFLFCLVYCIYMDTVFA
jgi:hypothetical protein